MLALVRQLHGLDVTNTTWHDSVDSVASECLVFIYVNSIAHDNDNERSWYPFKTEVYSPLYAANGWLCSS